MDIIEVGNLCKSKPKIKVKCCHCDTKVKMAKEDYTTSFNEEKLSWICPICDKKNVTKRKSRNNILAVAIAIIFVAIVTIIGITNCFKGQQQQELGDKIYICYFQLEKKYEVYVDSYSYDGQTLVFSSNGNKTTLAGVAVMEIIEPVEEVADLDN